MFQIKVFILLYFRKRPRKAFLNYKLFFTSFVFWLWDISRSIYMGETHQCCLGHYDISEDQAQAGQLQCMNTTHCGIILALVFISFLTYFGFLRYILWFILCSVLESRIPYAVLEMNQCRLKRPYKRQVSYLLCSQQVYSWSNIMSLFLLNLIPNSISWL